MANKKSVSPPASELATAIQVLLDFQGYVEKLKEDLSSLIQQQCKPDTADKAYRPAFLTELRQSREAVTKAVICAFPEALL